MAVDRYGNVTDESGKFLYSDYSTSQAFKEAKQASDDAAAAVEERRKAVADFESNPTAANLAAYQAVLQKTEPTVRRYTSGDYSSDPNHVRRQSLVRQPVVTFTDGRTAKISTINPDYCIFNPEFCDVGFQPGGGPGEGPVQSGNSLYVSIQNRINSVTNIGPELADAVSGAISEGASAAADIAKNTSDAILQHLDSISGTIVNGVGSGVNALFGWLRDIGSFITSHIQDIVQFLVNNVGKVVKDVATIVESVLGPVVKIVSQVSAQIQDINDNLIQPIAKTVTGIINTISTLTVAIERDLHNGLQGILQLPSDIAGALTSLDATMNRTVEQLGKANKQTAIDVLIGGSKGAVGDHLSSLNETLSKLTSGGTIKTTFQDHVKLADECLQKGTSLAAEDAKAVYEAGGDWIKLLVNGLLYLISVVTVSADLIETQYELASEQAHKLCPINKLGPGDALQALRRGFVTEEEATEELLLQGWSKERQRIMRDLGKQLPGAEQLVDWVYRGIIDWDDASAGMKDLAFTPAQIAAIQRASVKLTSPSVALTLLQYGELSREAVKSVLEENRFSEAEIEATLTALYRPATSQEAYEGISNRTLTSKLNITGLVNDETLNRAIMESRADRFASPDPGKEDVWAFVRGALSEGLDDTAIRARFFAQSNLLDLNVWINLYFRGLRTRKELAAVLHRHHIPDDLHDDIITSHRALIPFRTIPAMVASGIISETYAKEQLMAHGFDLQATEALLTYAGVKANPKKAVKAQSLQAIAVGTAERFYRDGTITEQQFRDILAAHGDTPEVIDLTVTTIAHEEHLRARKSEAQQIIDEALAGAITDEEAQASLARANYTVAESARYMSTIRKQRRATVKLPSESDLHAFLKAGIIDIDDYRNGVLALGYQEQWADAFAVLREPKAATA